jgi:hypothetical protein
MLMGLVLLRSGAPADCQEALQDFEPTGTRSRPAFANMQENKRALKSSQVPGSTVQEPLPSTDLVSCNPTVIGQPTEVVTAHARIAATNSVLPAGVVGPTGFNWSDTPLGVVKSLDGSRYLFFGSDGSCHENCNLATERDGSITRTEGTLDNPLGRRPLTETILPTSTLNLPSYMLYAGGGSVYRVPPGSPGAGDLLLVYEAAQASFESGYQYPSCDSNGTNCYQGQNGFYAYLGLAQSRDDGFTWKDLGLIVAPRHRMILN